MTAEIAVMNRMGVALAADSVVSIYADGVQKKSHDSAVRPFMLSEWQPVGIMVYHHASLLGVPWETIIKLFRNDIRTNRFDKLEQYGHELISFLASRERLFPIDVQQKYFLQEFKGECDKIVSLANHLHDLIPLAERLSAERTLGKRAAIISEVIDDRLGTWEGRTDATDFTDQTASAFLGTMSGDVHSIIMRMFAEWPVEAEQVQKLMQIARCLVFKKHLETPSYTGLVIGGYGEMEHFPVLQHIVISGVYGDVLKYEETGVVGISEDKPSYIESFAETEAINEFLYGVSAPVWDEISNAAEIIGSAPVEALERVPGMMGAENEELLEETKLSSKKQALHVLETVRLLALRRFGEILGVIEILPLKELASVASTLVSLSSFNKQLSLEAETVGEPIDVAVISKGDGFIWIERKHYFKPELNHRYFRQSLLPRAEGGEKNVSEIQPE